MGFLEKGAWLLFVIFFAFKVAGVAELSWWGVFAPLLINYGIALFGIGLVWIGSWRQARRDRPWYEKL